MNAGLPGVLRLESLRLTTATDCGTWPLIWKRRAVLMTFTICCAWIERRRGKLPLEASKRLLFNRPRVVVVSIQGQDSRMSGTPLTSSLATFQVILADIARARRQAERTSAEAIQQRRPAVSVGLEVRYALIARLD